MDREKVVNDLEAIWVCCKNRQNIKAQDEIDREMFTDWAEIIDDAIALLKSQPQIVRCKDCKHYRYYGLSSDTVSECTIDHCYPDSEWFCADGERKDGK